MSAFFCFLTDLSSAYLVHPIYSLLTTQLERFGVTQFLSIFRVALASLKQTPSEEDRKRAEEALLKKIGKKGVNPSKTGLNLRDAKIIDTYVTEHMNKWSYDLANAVKDHIFIKKGPENGLPRSLYIGIETYPNGTIKLGPDGSRRLCVMVLCKSKCSPTEYPQIHIARSASQEDPPRKNAYEVMDGNHRIAKGVVEWLTGELFVEVITRKDVAKRDPKYDARAAMKQELANMQRLLGGKGIAKPACLCREIEEKGKPIRDSFFMPRYQDDLQRLREPMGSLQFGVIFSRICNLADGLATLSERDLVYADGKIENTLVADDGSLGFADFEMSLPREKYLQTLRDGKGLTGTQGYLSPECMHYSLRLEHKEQVLQYPKSRDMWATGLQALVIMAHGHRLLTDEVVKLYEGLKDKFTALIQNYCRQDQKYMLEHKNFVNYVRMEQYIQDYIDRIKIIIRAEPMELDHKEKTLKLVDIVREMLRANPVCRITPPQLVERLNALR